MNSSSLHHKFSACCSFPPVNSFKQDRIVMSSQLSCKHSIFRTPLPDTCIGFTSSEGKEIFRESLINGYANVYFQVAEQFKTQIPATCGLTNIVLALNAFRIDPKRIWKSIYRWYDEAMLCCCIVLDDVRKNGMTLNQFANIAVCNNLDINVVRMGHESWDLTKFRELVKDICADDNRILACNYTRKVLQQVEDGHFAPIGAYNTTRDMVLILDTARYKYEPHWVELPLLWEAMKPCDTETKMPRGFAVLQKAKVIQPSLLFKLQNSFRLAISSHSIMYTPMSHVLSSWETTVEIVEDCSKTSESSEDQKTSMFEALNKSLKSLFQSESFLAVKVEEGYFDGTAHQCEDHFTELIQAIENTVIFKYVEAMRTGLQEENMNLIHNNNDAAENSKDQLLHSNLFTCHKKNLGNAKQIALELTKSHFISMLFFSWPYKHAQQEEICDRVCLLFSIRDIIRNTPDILQNEVTCLQQRIKSLISLRKHFNNN